MTRHHPHPTTPAQRPAGVLEQIEEGFVAGGGGEGLHGEGR